MTGAPGAGGRPLRILFLSPYVPSRVRVRPYSWIRSLVALGHDVHLVALTPPDDGTPTAEGLRALGVPVDLFPLTRLRTLANAAWAMPRLGTPLQLAYSRQARAARHVEQLAASGRYDVVHVEHMRGVALASRVGPLPVVFDAVDSISALFAEAVRSAPSRATRWMARLDLARSRRFEARAPSVFSRVVVTSPREASAFVDLAGPSARDRLLVVGNGVDADYFRPPATSVGRAVVFTGKLSYHANAAAAVRLVERVMPAVWAGRPATPVILAGKDPPPEVRALGRHPQVEVTGDLEDMRTAFARAAVAVCPLVYGAGIQNKVLEALASGVPAIVTPAVAGALSGEAGRHYLVAESDAELAAAVTATLDDALRRRTLAMAGRAYVERHHRWETLASLLVEGYRAALGERLSAAT